MLLIAGILEVGWAIGLKYTHGFSRLLPSLATILAMMASLGLLGMAVRTLPIGTAYATWTGIGTMGTVLVGIVLLGESASPARILCLCLILAGIVGLKLIPHA
jgi:quaternary ammonium compound-resistance protein SugE